MKLKPKLDILRANPPWFVEARFGYHKELKDLIKSWPGSKWEPMKKVWLVPSELVQILSKAATEYGFEVVT